MKFQTFYFSIHSADNRIDAAGGLEKFKTKIAISHDGKHMWFAPAIFRSMCEIDIMYFPFDEQHCDLRFGSWAYDITSLDMFIDYKNTGLFKEIYERNTEWQMLSMETKREEVCWCCEKLAINNNIS